LQEKAFGQGIERHDREAREQRRAQQSGQINVSRWAEGATETWSQIKPSRNWNGISRAPEGDPPFACANAKKSQTMTATIFTGILKAKFMPPDGRCLCKLLCIKCL